MRGIGGARLVWSVKGPGEQRQVHGEERMVGRGGSTQRWSRAEHSLVAPGALLGMETWAWSRVWL
jgi:hypothetical protein